MRIEITWDGTDVSMGRKIKDVCGSRCVIISSDSKEHPWSIYRSADGFFHQPMSLDGIVNRLNNDKYTPEEL